MSYPELLSPEETLADAKQRLSIPRITVLCGSTRFWQAMADAAWAETLHGRIVVRPDVDMKRPGAGYTDAAAVKVDLDELHRAKIRLADEVLVVGDYAGDSTRGEIAYAREIGKPIRFTHPSLEAKFTTVTVGGLPVPIDNVIWLERHPCGCVASAVIAHVPSEWSIATPEQACGHFNRSDREREQAKRAGRTFEPVTGDTYRADFSSNWHCTDHAKPATATH